MLRWAAIGIGILVWSGALGASIYLNYVAGLDLDGGGDKGKAIGAINIAADLWKALCPVFLWVLWKNGRRPTAILLSLSWVAAFVYAMTNALGIVAERRGAWTEGREATRAVYESAAQDLLEAQTRRQALQSIRTPAEVQAAVDAALAIPVREGERIRGTVGGLSSKCDRPNPRTAEACAEVYALRRELVAAAEGARLDERVAHLKTEVARLRERGGRLEADPNARLISRFTFGWIAVDDAPLLRLVLLALFIELVSAFLPVGLVEYAHATARHREPLVATGRDRPRPDQTAGDTSMALHHTAVGAVIDYVAERTEPADEAVALGVEELYDDYRAWCVRHRLVELSRSFFTEEFDRIREHPDVAGKVRKFATRYYGIRIVGNAIARLPMPARRS